MEILPLAIHPSARPLRQASAQTYLAGSEFVVLSRRTGEYLALNQTASALWERCDGSRTVADVVSILAATFRRPQPEVLADVLATLSDFHSRDLVSIYMPGLGRGHRVADENRIEITFMHHTVEVWTDDSLVAKNVHRIFGGLMGGGGVTVAARLTVTASENGFLSNRNGAEQGEHPTLQSAVTWLKKQVIRTLIDARSDLVWLHAGAVAKDGKVLFCLGEGGSGKSTLVMSLVKEGWAYLSDDVIAYDPVTGGALPFPLAPFYRVWGDEMVDDLNDLRKVKFETRMEDVAEASLAVAALAFPSFSPSGPAMGRSRGAASAAVGLADQVLNADSHIGDILQVCTELTSRAPAFDVFHTPGVTPLEIVQRLIDW